MSEVDNRIVQLQMQNQQFERNSKVSLNTLDKLKSALNFGSQTKSLQNLQENADKFQLSTIQRALETISGRFTNFGIMGVTALQNIANAAISTGTQLIKSLTLDPILTGFNEYETKINAIQTILTNTKSKGTTLDDVTQSLNELNEYADLTIYNFAEMARNIGTFTAAGVDLETSVLAIKGIANLGAGSGSSPQQVATAMYQLSQALAAGRVSLQDWNSVVNAGMGGEYFQNALKQTAKEMGKVVDESISFRESISVKGGGESWLTSDVLVKTLSKFADDQTLVDAATQVKSLTQMFDTMKESVQSGWAISWEYIIGDKDQATETLTAINNAFSDLVGPAEEARNAVLKFWNENGGRDALVESLFNAFDGLLSIFKPIKEAFSEIFPPMTGQKLVDMTKSLADLTKNFKLSDETAKNLKNTFKGVFAIVDILWQGIKTLGKFLADLIGFISPVGSGFLSITGRIGEFLANVDSAIKSTDSFGQVLDKIRAFFQPVTDGIKKIADAIKGLFGATTGSEADAITSFGENVADSLTPLEKAGSFLERAFDRISSAITTVGNRIKEFFGNLDFNDAATAVGAGGIVGIAAMLKKLVDTLSGVSKDGKLSEFVKTIKGGLDSVRETLEGWQKNLKANQLIKIAAAIGIITASVIGLAGVDPTSLGVALGAISAMFVELFASMAIFNKAMGSKDFDNIKTVTSAMILLSTAVGILTISVKALAKLSWEELAKGIVGISASLGLLIGSAKLLDFVKGNLVKTASGLLIFAAAIDLMSIAVENFSKLSWDELARGLVGLAGSLGIFVGAAKLLDFVKGSLPKTAAAMLIFASAINLLEVAVANYAELSWEEIGKGLTGLAGSLGIVVGALKLLDFVKGSLPKTAASLLLLSSAIGILALSVNKMGSMSWNELGVGLTGLAGSLTAIVLATKFMPKDLAKQAAGLVIMAAAISVLGSALQSMGSMTWEQMGVGLVSLAGSLTILAVALKFLDSSGAVKAGASLTVVSVGLVALAGVMKVLGSLTWNEVATGLIALGGAIAIVVAAAAVINTMGLTPALFALGGAVALLGVAVAGVGVGMLSFANGLEALGSIGSEGAENLTLVLTELLNLIPLFLTKVGEGIIALATVIASNGSAIIGAVSTILISLATAVTEASPAIVTAIVTLITTLLTTIADNMPTIIQAGMDILLAIMEGIRNNIGRIVTVATDIIVEFLNGISENLPRIIDAGFNLIITFINSLADTIRERGEEIGRAGGNLAGALIEGVVDGIMGAVEEVKDALLRVARKALDGFKEFFGINSPSKVMRDESYHIGEGAALGLKDSSKLMENEAVSAGKKTYFGMKKSLDMISDLDSDMRPTITPVLDLSMVEKGASGISDMFASTSIGLASDVNGQINSTRGTNQKQEESQNVYNFNQYNTSPKALSKLDIYRQTKNQFAAFKAVINAT